MVPWMLLWPLGIGLTLGACAPQIGKPSPGRPTATAAPSAFCSAWKPIYYDRLHDTVPTIEQAQSNNAARAEICGD